MLSAANSDSARQHCHCAVGSRLRAARSIDPGKRNLTPAYTHPLPPTLLPFPPFSPSSPSICSRNATAGDRDWGVGGDGSVQRVPRCAGQLLRRYRRLCVVWAFLRRIPQCRFRNGMYDSS